MHRPLSFADVRSISEIRIPLGPYYCGFLTVVASIGGEQTSSPGRCAEMDRLIVGSHAALAPARDRREVSECLLNITPRSNHECTRHSVLPSMRVVIKTTHKHVGFLPTSDANRPR
eukprot:COSAG02_NODE_731_length_17977_cov_21.672838_9_plen_116_part_00